MRETTMEYVTEVNRLTEGIMKRMSTTSIFDMSAEDLFVLQSSMRVLDISNKMLLKQAEILDQLNEKMDKLLKK